MFGFGCLHWCFSCAGNWWRFLDFRLRGCLFCGCVSGAYLMCFDCWVVCWCLR